MAVAALSAVVLHQLMPSDFRLAPHWIYPAFMVVFLVILVVGDPGRIDRERRWLKVTTGLMIGMITLVNAVSAARLVDGILTKGHSFDTARQLLIIGAVVFVTNLASEKGDSEGLDLIDHVEVIERHAGGEVVDAVLVHEGPIDGAILSRYRDEGAEPLSWPARGVSRLRVIRRDLLAPGQKLRHDPARTAQGLLEAWELVSTAPLVRVRA